MNAVLTSAIPSSWRLSELIPLFKGKCPIMECSNFRRIKLVPNTLKLFERIINHMLITIVELVTSISYLGEEDPVWIL